METQEHDKDIPILTHIIQPGDASMENHFDASYFDDDKELDTNNSDEFQEEIQVTDDDLIQEIEEIPLENTFDKYITEDENSKDIADIKDIDKISEDITDVEDIDKIAESIADINKTNEEPEKITATATANDFRIKEIELKDTVDLLISNAVKEVLPSIEKQLTEELGKQIYQKLFSELSKDN